MLKKIKRHTTSHNIDIAFYKDLYNDLSNLNRDQLEIHWINYGQQEARFSSFTDLLTFYNIDEKELEDFDFDFYTTYYIDLGAKITTRNQAIHHYLEYGIKENRFMNLDSLLKSRDFDIKTIEKYIEEDFLNTLNHINNIDIDYNIFINNTTGLSLVPIKVSRDNNVNAKFYLSLAENFIIKEKIYVADYYLNISLNFNETHKALAYKGDLKLNTQDYKSAITFYKQALYLNNQMKYVYLKLSKCYESIHDLKNAVKTMIIGVSKIERFYENNTHEVESLMQKYFEKMQYTYFNQYILDQKRANLVLGINELSSYVYNIYFELYRGFEKKDSYNTINKNKILIIGDYHVEQCVRYRIDQKVEQLKFQRVEVNSINWTELDNYTDDIPFYDIVIFYRVPSTIEVIKTIAKVNALNKVSIYEIDDLLFEPIYPDKIENYGGSIGLDTYYGLLLGMAKFNSIAQLCSYGIASTKPLKKKLEKLGSKNNCILHRNGLDSHTVFEKNDRENSSTIDLFYGSGTLAHNEDFIDLVLPSIIKLMKKYQNIRLIIVGHLTLPKVFVEEFKERVIQLPKVNIKAYYSYLKQADINIAVLHKDEITDAKSELKWFEAGCFYIPSVVSGTQNYLDVIKEGEDGFIANAPEEWYEKLKALVVDKKLRNTIGTNVANRIKDEYSIETLSGILAQNLSALVDENYPIKEKRKKIALVNVFFPPQSIGGATRVVADNFDVLVDSYSDEYEICVFTSEVEHLEPYKMSVYNYKGSRVYKSNILYREHMDWHPKDENMYDLFTKFLETEKPDKVHFHCVQRLTASVVEATRDMQIPYLVTVHDAWWISDLQFLVDKNDKVYPDGHPDPFYERVLPENMTVSMSIERESYLKSLLRDAEHVLTVSESFAKIYRKNDIQNIEVTKNGISSKIEWLPKETSQTQKVVCGHIGGMSTHKGYDILKKAVLELQPTNLEFLVVDHSKEGSYISKEKWGKINVKFIGRQKQDEMVELYQQIDVLFAPSIWPESFGLVTREASACGCWIVASNLGGIGEDVLAGKNGFVINPTQKAIEETLSKIDKNYKKYKTLAERGTVSMVEEQVERLKEFLND